MNDKRVALSYVHKLDYRNRDCRVTTIRRVLTNRTSVRASFFLYGAIGEAFELLIRDTPRKTRTNIWRLPTTPSVGAVLQYATRNRVPLFTSRIY